jgi:hypothetical protein
MENLCTPELLVCLSHSNILEDPEVELQHCIETSFYVRRYMNYNLSELELPVTLGL